MNDLVKKRGKLTPIGWAGTILLGGLALGIVIVDYAAILFAIIPGIIALCSYAYAREKTE